MSYASVFRSGLFKGRTILVTGGGSGIGRCIAHELASLGGRVVITGRKEEKLEAVCSELHEDYGKDAGAWYQCDIRNEERVQEVVAEVFREHGPIHGLVNNAGGQFPSPIHKISKKGFEAVVSTNLTGTFLMSREVFTRSMRKNGGGSIVNIVADMWRGMPLMGHSGAARAGVSNLTKTTAVEWASAGVRVNAIAPGTILSSGLDQYDPAFLKAAVKGIKKSNLASRGGTEGEVSSAVTFLLSDAASFITGVTLKVDGGSTLNGHFIFPPVAHENNKPFQPFARAVLPKAMSEALEAESKANKKE